MITSINWNPESSEYTGHQTAGWVEMNHVRQGNSSNGIYASTDKNSFCGYESSFLKRRWNH